jgi:hypothetical protein
VGIDILENKQSATLDFEENIQKKAADVIGQINLGINQAGFR